MFDTLFGMPLAARFFIAFVVVLALIGFTAWLVRRFAANRLGGGSMRGRQPRLAVIDAANVDARRKLVLIRRDNIEHLLMIGGPSDVVIEPNIVRAGGAREAMREPLRGDNGARSVGAENGWPLQPINEPRGREDNWVAPEAPARPRATETTSGLSPDLSARLGAPEIVPLPRREPRAAVPPASAADAGGDHNLAEIAQQLEAALRIAPVAPVEPPAAKSPEAPRPPREVKMRIDPRIDRGEPKLDVKPEPKLAAAVPEPKADFKFEPKIEPNIQPKPEPKIEPKSDIHVERVEPKVEPKLEAKPNGKAQAEPKPDAISRQDFYDNLEEEMASLLGRPPGKP